MIKAIADTKLEKYSEICRGFQGTALLEPTDLNTEIIYLTTLQIKAYFDVVIGLCQMYQQVYLRQVDSNLRVIDQFKREIERGRDSDEDERGDGQTEMLQRARAETQQQISRFIADVSKPLSAAPLTTLPSHTRAS